MKTSGLGFLFLSACLLHALLPISAGAQVTLSSVIVHFSAGARPVHNLSVSNSSDTALYVTVSVEKFEDPGEENSPSFPSEDILISPKRFSVPANGYRTVRLLLRHRPAEMEQVYRVTFKPEDRGHGDIEEVRMPDSPQTLLRILTGMGILVFADPVNPKTDLAWKRTRDRVVFVNSGNVHVRLINGMACLPDQPEETCDNLPTRRVYGGRSYEVVVPQNSTVIYTTRDGASGVQGKIVIPPEEGVQSD